MNYDYNFTRKEKELLYKEFKKIINSQEYKLLKKEYNKLVNQIAKNVINSKLKEPFWIAYLLNNNINDFYKINTNNKNDKLDLDILYKLWGSRVFTNEFSNRHIVSLINDILIKSGYMSCKLLTCKKDFNLSKFNILYDRFKIPNDILLCLLINNKKFMFDTENKELLRFNNILSNGNYSCYIPTINKENILYFINKEDFNNLEINDDYLFALNEYMCSNEFTKNDYINDLYIKEQMNKLDNCSINLLDVNLNDIIVVSSLNKEISEKQNDIYKKVKKL